MERAAVFKSLYKDARRDLESLRTEAQALADENRALQARLAPLAELGNRPWTPCVDAAHARFDATVVSFPKSGRTWLSYLYYNYGIQFLSPAERCRYDEVFTYRPEESPAFMRALATARALQQFPRLRFSHGAPGRGELPYQQLKVSSSPFQDGPIILLVRDPRDVIVSYFHHVRNPDKGYGADADLSISDFIRNDLFGIRYTIEHMNQWATERDAATVPFDILFYEDLMESTERRFRDFLFFAGADPVSSRWVANAVQHSQFDKLKSREWAHRQHNNASTDDNMMRMRRGRIGGFHDELTAEDVEYLNEQLATHLDPVFTRYIASAAVD